jgi:hypothetical protein
MMSELVWGNCLLTLKRLSGELVEKPVPVHIHSTSVCDTHFHCFVLVSNYHSLIREQT